MRWCLSTPGSPGYVLPVVQSTSVIDVFPYTRRRSLMIYLEAVIKRVERCTWRPRSSELRDAVGGQDRLNSEIHSKAVIERVWKCTWGPRSSESRDALGGCDRANWRCTGRPWSSEIGDTLWGCDRVRFEMQLETEIQWTQRCTRRPWLSEFRDALAGYEWARLEEYWEAVNLEGGATAADTLPLSRKLAGSGRLSILGWCWRWCMLYSVLSHDHCMER